jgi:hypothetical protein
VAVDAPERGRLSAVTADGILSGHESRIRGMTGGNPMTIQRTIYTSPGEALAALIRALVADEQRYQLSSAELYARDQNGEMGDQEAKALLDALS